MDKMRVIKKWSDYEAGSIYLLQRFIPAFIFFKAKWQTVTYYTKDVKKAKKWANHYKVEIVEID